MEVHPFCKEQKSIFCEGKVCIALPSCQLLVDRPNLAIHSIHGTAELGEALRLQPLLVFMQSATDRTGSMQLVPAALFRMQPRATTGKVQQVIHTKHCVKDAGQTCLTKLA